MTERCPRCGLNFGVAKRHLMGDDWLAQLIAWQAIQEHLEKCPPIFSREGQERLVDAIAGYKQSGKEVGLDRKGGGRCGEADRPQDTVRRGAAGWASRN